MGSKLRRAILLGVIVLMTLALGSCGWVLGFLFPNEFEVTGATFEISKMYVVNHGKNAEGNFDIFVWLVSDGISATANNSWSGSGDEIGFWINTSTSALAEGTYGYNPETTHYTSTLYYGLARVGYSFSTYETDSDHVINGGTLDIWRATLGDDWVIDFDGAGTNGETIYAHFRGPLEISVIDGPALSSTLPLAKTR